MWHAGSSSPTRHRTPVPCIGSVESYPLDHQGSPLFLQLLKTGVYVTEWGRGGYAPPAREIENRCSVSVSWGDGMMWGPLGPFFSPNPGPSSFGLCRIDSAGAPVPPGLRDHLRQLTAPPEKHSASPGLSACRTELKLPSQLGPEGEDQPGPTRPSPTADFPPRARGLPSVPWGARGWTAGFSLSLFHLRTPDTYLAHSRSP